jgi:Zn finger protein HypA/HybF involved in hydrogenase expression
MRRSAVLIVLSIGLLGLAAVLFYVQARGARGPQPVPVRCENGHEFVPKRGATKIVCPTCGSTKIVYLIYYRCKECGKVFVAYERDPETNTYRAPGGEWVDRTAIDFRPMCPECGGETEFIKDPNASIKKTAPDQ